MALVEGLLCTRHRARNLTGPQDRSGNRRHRENEATAGCSGRWDHLLSVGVRSLSLAPCCFREAPAVEFPHLLLNILVEQALDQQLLLL